MKKENIVNKDWSFDKGWQQLRQKDVKECRKEIMSALNITTGAAFCMWLRGEVEPTVTKVSAIEDIFKTYGITKVWGKD